LLPPDPVEPLDPVLPPDPPPPPEPDDPAPVPLCEIGVSGEDAQLWIG
jgi:hypothetical protein